MIRLTSAAILGLTAVPIDVEVDATPGLHVFRIVGLPDKAIAESKERITAAIKNSGAQPPGGQNKRITVNLAPADIKKEGPAYDLPIALGFLAATEQLRFAPEGKLFAGEVALDGSIRPIRGVLAIACMAQKEGFTELYIPKANAREASLIHDLSIIPVETLSQLMMHLDERIEIAPEPKRSIQTDAPIDNRHDIDNVRGQKFAKRALTIAAAGGHNVLFVGPPGSGKTLLARSMTAILPSMTEEEALETSTIFSIAGHLDDTTPVISRRPFRSPHHTASAVSIIGGGARPMPGEITLAHNGVLFLDEMPEFRRDVLEALRQPLEDGTISIARAGGRATFPANFCLVAAMNPCPCGFRGDEQKPCTCTAGERARYQRKLSGPLLDRIDLHVTVPRVSHKTLTSKEAPQDTATIINALIEKTRAIQRKRFQNTALHTNASMGVPEIKQHCNLLEEAELLLKEQMDDNALSARGYHRILKVARTIADMEGCENIQTSHVLEALHYRPAEGIFS